MVGLLTMVFMLGIEEIEPTREVIDATGVASSVLSIVLWPGKFQFKFARF